MEFIAEHFGTGLLALLGGAFLLAIIFSCIRDGGVIKTAVEQFMIGLCG